MTKFEAMYCLIGDNFTGTRCKDCAHSRVNASGIRTCEKLDHDDNIVHDQKTCVFAWDIFPAVD